MKFKFDIKSESDLKKNNRILLDEDSAIEESIRKKRIIAYY